jgi:hypothetical protein
MSAFAVVLVAGMAVGSGPEKVSVGVEQRLDLRGRWEGVWLDEAGREWEATSENGAVFGDTLAFVRFIRARDVADEGAGRVRVFYPRVGSPALGIYQVRGDCFLICFREARLGRPTAFRGGDGQNLITLRRVRPGK